MNIAALKYTLEPRRSLEFPMNWEEVFGNRRKIIVEIGFGGGEYLAEMAKANPDINFVGFEVSMVSCYKAQLKFLEYGLTNVKVINQDARFCIRELFADESITKIIVNFPCPWPKKKHEERRIFVESFRDTLAAVLKNGGSMELATDVDWYAQEVFDNFKIDENFEVQEIVENFERPVKTRYEQKWEKEGRNKYLVVVKKVKAKKIERLIKEEAEMPHSYVSTINEEKLYGLIRKQFTDGELTFIIKDIFEKENKTRFLLRAIAADGDFNQQYFISIGKKENKYLIKLDNTVAVYRTPAIKYSVFKVAEEIGGI